MMLKFNIRPFYLVILVLLLAACQGQDSQALSPASGTPPAPTDPPPTETVEPIPPTGTATDLPPTETPLPTATAVPTATPDPNVYTFAAIGDYGLWSLELEAVANLVKSWEPEFIITLGDNNYPNGEASTIDQNIGQFFHEFIFPYKGEYGTGADKNRFFPSLGNHDWVTEGAVPYLDYFELPGNERYYDFIWGPVHFFSIDADTHEPDGVGRSTIQAQWLKEKLAASTSPFQVVYMHQPPYSSGRHGSTDYIQWPFAEWGADAVLAGHDHSYERIIVDDIPYIVNGLGGHINRYFFFTRIEGSQFQYRSGHGAVRGLVNGNTLTFEFVTVEGEVLDSHTITAETHSALQLGEPETGVLPASVTHLPDPSEYEWLNIGAGFEKPLLVTHAGDGSRRVFVVEQDGVIKILGQDNAFLDIRSQVGRNGNEQGLLGLSFDPAYADNGFFYVNYTDLEGDTVVSRFQVFVGDAGLADPTSEQVLLAIDQPFGNHNGGHLAFGPDRKLYIASGDGGSAGDPLGNAQNKASLLGKILRLDVSSGEVEVFAYGLRNPWRFAFDQATGDLYIGDVGQGEWEEVNFLPAGQDGELNFGWDLFEGTHSFEGQPAQVAGLIAPVAEYAHSEGGCSVTGGEVYRGRMFADFQGVYLYGDYCTGYVWGLVRSADGAWLGGLMFTTNARITSFGLDEDGEMYLVSRDGNIYKLARR